MITTIELLDFFVKAKKLSIQPDISQIEDGYYINLYYDWYDSNDWRVQTVFINNEGTSDWTEGDYHFDTMNEILDEKLEEQKQKEIKAQKRKNLIARLSDEEKELLGVK